MKQRQTRFGQLSKEIVAYVQSFGHDTDKCVNFVRYELNLRCVSKDKLRGMSDQTEPTECCVCGEELELDDSIDYTDEHGWHHETCAGGWA